MKFEITNRLAYETWLKSWVGLHVLAKNGCSLTIVFFFDRTVRKLNVCRVN